MWPFELTATPVTSVVYSGSNVSDAATVTIPAHAVGDLIVIFAYRGSSNTLPGKPSAGGTVPTYVDIDAATGAEVEHGLARLELGQGRGVPAAEGGGHGLRWQRRRLAAPVELRGDRIVRTPRGCWAAASCSQSGSLRR